MRGNVVVRFPLRADFADEIGFGAWFLEQPEARAFQEERAEINRRAGLSEALPGLLAYFGMPGQGHISFGGTNVFNVPAGDALFREVLGSLTLALEREWGPRSRKAVPRFFAADAPDCLANAVFQEPGRPEGWYMSTAGTSFYVLLLRQCQPRPR